MLQLKTKTTKTTKNKLTIQNNQKIQCNGIVCYAMLLFVVRLIIGRCHDDYDDDDRKQRNDPPWRFFFHSGKNISNGHRNTAATHHRRRTEMTFIDRSICFFFSNTISIFSFCFIFSFFLFAFSFCCYCCFFVPFISCHHKYVRLYA
jgi:hypothetical protein